MRTKVYIVTIFPRIIESLRSAKTSQIMKSNHEPNTNMATKPYPEVPCLHKEKKKS